MCVYCPKRRRRDWAPRCVGLTLLMLQISIKALLTRKIIRVCLHSRGFYVVNPPPISFGVPWRVRGLVNSGMISTTMEEREIVETWRHCGSLWSPKRKRKRKKEVVFSHMARGCVENIFLKEVDILYMWSLFSC
jgi:hypothetical protein